MLGLCWRVNFESGFRVPPSPWMKGISDSLLNITRSICRTLALTLECVKILAYLLIDLIKSSIAPNKNLKNPYGVSVRAYADKVSMILFSMKYSRFSPIAPWVCVSLLLYSLNLDSSNCCSFYLPPFLSSSFKQFKIISKLWDIAGTSIIWPLCLKSYSLTFFKRGSRYSGQSSFQALPFYNLLTWSW